MSLSTKTLLRAAAYAGEPRARGHRTASPWPDRKGRMAKSNKVGADGQNK